MSENENLERNENRETSYDDAQGGERRGRSGGQRSDSQDRGGFRRGGGGPGGRRGRRRRKEDYFDVNQTEPSYKDIDTLKKFLSDRAKIRPRRQTALSSKNQRKLAREIKRARHMALLPYTDDQLRR